MPDEFKFEIVSPMSLLAIFMWLLGLGGMTLALVQTGPVALVPYALALAFMLILLSFFVGGKSEITINEHHLIEKRIRPWRTTTRQYEIRLICRMRVDTVHDNVGHKRFVFEYQDHKQVLGVPFTEDLMKNDEARRIATGLARFIPVDTSILPPPSDPAESRTNLFSFRRNRP